MKLPATFIQKKILSKSSQRIISSYFFSESLLNLTNRTNRILLLFYSKKKKNRILLFEIILYYLGKLRNFLFVLYKKMSNLTYSYYKNNKLIMNYIILYQKILQYKRQSLSQGASNTQLPTTTFGLIKPYLVFTRSKE